MANMISLVSATVSESFCNPQPMCATVHLAIKLKLAVTRAVND